MSWSVESTLSSTNCRSIAALLLLYSTQLHNVARPNAWLLLQMILVDHGATSNPLRTKAQNIWNFNMFWMVLTMMTDSCYEKLILAMLSQKSRMCRPRSVALPRSSKVSNIWIASLEKLLKSIARFHNCEANEFWKDFHKLPFLGSKRLWLPHQT